MLLCVPQTIFSWNHSVSGLAIGVAQLTLERFSDQGAIAFGDTKLRVRKEGWINPRWALELDGNTVASAKKRGVFRYLYDLTCDEGALLLKPHAWTATGGYDLLLGDAVVGVVEPEYLRTRKSRAKFEATVSEVTQLFSLWLIVMVWRNTTG